MKLYRTGLLLLAVPIQSSVCRAAAAAEGGFLVRDFRPGDELDLRNLRRGEEGRHRRHRDQRVDVVPEQGDDRRSADRGALPSAEARPQARRNRNLVGAHAFRREIDLSQTDEAVRQRSVELPPRAALLVRSCRRGSCCSTRAGISGTGSATRGSRSWCARSWGSCFPMRRRSAPRW